MERERISLADFIGDKDVLEQTSFWSFLQFAGSAAGFLSQRDGAAHVFFDEKKIVLNLAAGVLEFGSGYDEGDALRYSPPEELAGEAPEESRGRRFALAVLLFRLLTLSYPYEGQLYRAAASPEAFYQGMPHYIFSEGKNAAEFGTDDTAIGYYSVYPASLQNLFYRAFELHAYPAEAEWLSEIAALEEGLTLCWNCGAEVFGDTGACWRCRKGVSPMRIRHMDNGVVLGYAPLKPGYQFTDGKNSFEIIARGSCWGIKNNSSAVWKWMKPSGRIAEVEQNQAVPISLGIQIRMKGGFKIAVERAEEQSAAESERGE